MLKEVGRRYENPDLGVIEVRQTTFNEGVIPEDPQPIFQAVMRLQVVNAALTYELTGDDIPEERRFDKEEVDLEANPNSRKQVEHLASLLVENQLNDHQINVTAVLKDPEYNEIYGPRIAAVGRLAYADGRDDETKKRRPNPPASQNIAVFKSLHVLPEFQDKGVGHAIMHFLAGINPRHMPTQVDDVTDLHPRFSRTLQGRGYEPIDSYERMFAGRAADVIKWGGPDAPSSERLGQMLEMEDGFTWLAGAQSIIQLQRPRTELSHHLTLLQR